MIELRFLCNNVCTLGIATKATADRLYVRQCVQMLAFSKNPAMFHSLWVKHLTVYCNVFRLHTSFSAYLGQTNWMMCIAKTPVVKYYNIYNHWIILTTIIEQLKLSFTFACIYMPKRARTIAEHTCQVTRQVMQRILALFHTKTKIILSLCLYNHNLSGQHLHFSHGLASRSHQAFSSRSQFEYEFNRSYFS